jgi:hypothetical protein
VAEYPTYETEAGQASEALTYQRACEHLRLAAECMYVLGHLRKANDDEVIGSGFLGIGQILEKTVKQVTMLATGSKMKWN